ncbi:MAG: peptidylprolyl isomerase [Planctomycetota bacterium]
MRIAIATVTVGACLSTLLVCPACTTLSKLSKDDAREVSLAEFAGEATAETIDPSEATSEVTPTDTIISAAPPALSERPAPQRPGDSVVVDSLVGQVNGRPVFADEFLEPLSDRLRAEARDKTGRARAEAFRYIINLNLETVIENELILAEAEAGLTPEQQMGLFALLRGWREEMIRQGRTRSAVESNLRAEMGIGLEEYLDNQKKALLVRELARRRVEPRVIVSWRDVEREYQRRYEEFNPPASVTLARIRLHATAQGELVEQTKTRLAAGDEFAAIATELGFADGGRWATFPLGPNGLAGLEVGPEIRTALEGLEVGGTTDPIEIGPTVLWLHIQEMTATTSRDLYDPEVQRLLIADIQGRRREEEWNRYIASLLDRGIFDELDEMADRLYEIAMERYGR